MKNVLKLLLFFSTVIFSQENIWFVNYGPQANKSEGDPNYFQIINFELQNSTYKNLLLQIFDPDCIGKNDSQFGDYNSQFRFSLYKGELTEQQITSNIKANTSLLPQHIYSKTFSNEYEYDDQWIDLVRFSGDSLSGNKFSLLITGTSGNDGNTFKIRLLNADSKELIDQLKVYSFQPTIRLYSTNEIISFIAENTHDNIILNTFDFDGAKFSYSSILKNREMLYDNIKTDWNSILINLSQFEKNNPVAINFYKINIQYNDLTFYLTDSNSNPISINLNHNYSLLPDLPNVNNSIKYHTCNKITFFTDDFNNQKYLWQFEDGSVFNNAYCEKTFDTAGNYTCQLYAEKGSNSITRAIVKSINFKINKLPHAKISDVKTLAPNENIMFDASQSFDDDGYIKFYEWDFGDGNNNQGKSVIHKYSTPGKYFVKLKVTDDFEYDCNFSYDSLLITVNAQPIIKTKKEIHAAPNEKIIFDASDCYDTDGNIETYLWSFDNRTSKSEIKTDYSFPKPGIYFVKLIVTDNSTAINKSSEEIIKVIINNPPLPITNQKYLIAENDEITFDATKSFDKDGKIISYMWLINNKIYEGAITKYKFIKAGIYNVKLIIKDDSEMINNSDSTLIKVIVNSNPKAIIENEKYVIENKVFFDASKSYDEDGKITKYLWDFGDGTTSSNQKVWHTYKLPGKYFVTLNVFDDTNVKNNFSIDTSFVIINKKPIADAGKDYLISSNKTIKFSANNSIDPDGKISKVKWFLNNNLISKEFDFEHTFLEPGKYIVKLEVEDDFVKPLKDIDSALIIVNKQPVAKINCINKAIPNQKIKFDASSSFDSDGKIVNYFWTIDENKFNSKIVEKSFSKPGIYKIILQVEDNSKVENSIASDTVLIKINSSPIIRTTNEIFTCEKLIHFDASNSYDQDGDQIYFTWFFPQSNDSLTGASIFYYFKDAGTFPVLLTINDMQGLSNSISKQLINIIIHQPPIADAGHDTIVCTQDLTIFNGLNSKSFNNRILTYEWIFSDSTKYKGGTIVKTFDKAGIYNVVLKVTDDSNLPCNSGVDSKVIKVIDTPHANAGADINACVGVPVQFDGSKSTDIDGIINSYIWDFGDGEIGGGEKPRHIYEKVGTYKVVLTVTGDSKSDCNNVSKDELIVNVYDGPVANFTVQDSTDENTKLIFDASKSFTPNGIITKYEWDFGDGNKANGKLVEHIYKNFGNYIVTLKIHTDIKNDCNSSSSSSSIYVNKKPVAKIKTTKKAALNELIFFDASLSYDINGKISKYIWDFGDGTTSEGIKVYHSFSKSGKFKIKLKVQDETSTKQNFDIDELDIQINSSPIPEFNVNNIYQTNELIKLDASLSSDSDGKIINYKWFINDKFYSSNKIDEIRLQNEGVYNIKLLVEDDSETSNRFAILTKTIQINNNK
ncbi:MAG: PKD domain-containing protein [Melioribacteraceae bacterium]|nr:PKD domain-containing protein [Melioribacteraceae bacterium]